MMQLPVPVKIARDGGAAGQGWRREGEDAPFHEPNRCWTTGRVMGESLGMNGRVAGDNFEATGGASTIRRSQ